VTFSKGERRAADRHRHSGIYRSYGVIRRGKTTDAAAHEEARLGIRSFSRWNINATQRGIVANYAQVDTQQKRAALNLGLGLLR